jgi:non-ribosomal peptide synthetase component E (peptide arylation enzyme)
MPEDTDWYYSGDYGRLDEEGRLYVLGRVKHQINRGGLKVDPVEVENALLECPAIADAAVIGVNDNILGELVCACVVPARDEAPSLEQLRSFLGDVLASYKLPEELCVLESIPRTRTGKVDHELLQARINNNGGAKSV